MRWIVESVVIFLTFLVFMLGVAWWQGRKPRIPLARLADPAPLPGERDRHDPPHDPAVCLRCRYWARQDGLPRAGYFDLPDTLARFAAPDGPYGPFPVDTGPLLHLGEKDAANVALQRDIAAMCAEAEAKIPPRWR